MPLPRLQSSWKNASVPFLSNVTVNLVGSGTDVVPCASSIDCNETSCQVVPGSAGGVLLASGELEPDEHATAAAAVLATRRAVSGRNVICTQTTLPTPGSSPVRLAWILGR